MSSSPVNFDRYSTILFMDSMVALEGKPLASQPWQEIDPVGPILLLVVPQVSKEIDKRKRDGRIGKRAREFNRLIGPAAELAVPTRISEGPPVVDLGIAACQRINWDALDDLDPEEPDARVVAQILHADGVPPERKLLFSQDINPIAMASRHGLKTRKMPEHWLLELEPSPNEKEINRLKARVKELEANEPDLDATLRFGVDEILQLFRVRPLDDDERHRLADRILSENPEVDQPRSSFMTRVDSDYDHRYKKYRDLTVPTHVATLHKRVETHYNQIPFTLHVENGGHIQAENLVIGLRAVGGTLNHRFACYPIFGPVAPKPDPYRLTRLPHINPWRPPPQPRRDGVIFAVGPNRSKTIEAHCADFRHGRRWAFNGIACINPRADSPFKIEVKLTASNLRGKVLRTFEIAYVSKQVALDELIDLEQHKWQVNIPMAAQFEEALQSRNLSWFEFVGDKNEGNEENENEEDGDEHLDSA
jgi:hypothetical protein